MEIPSKQIKYLSIVHRHTQAAMARALDSMGIGSGQYAYLLAVNESPGITQDKLTSMFFYNKSSVARAVTQLEGAGYVRRETDPADKRSYRLYLTDPGLAAVPEILRHLDQITRQLTDGFSQHEKQLSQKLLKRMCQNVCCSKLSQDPP